MSLFNVSNSGTINYNYQDNYKEIDETMLYIETNAIRRYLIENNTIIQLRHLKQNVWCLCMHAKGAYKYNVNLGTLENVSPQYIFDYLDKMIKN